MQNIGNQAGHAGGPLIVGRMGEQAQTERQPGALDMIHNRLAQMTHEIHHGCGRIATSLQRIAPTPQGVAEGSKEPPIHGTLAKLEKTATDLENAAKWLHELASRLDQIG